MKIAVLIKQTPDTAELPKVSADEVSSGSVQATMVINPWDEFAAEEAIDLGDRFDAEATAFSMGSDGSTDALKHALAMGVGSAILIEGNDAADADDWSAASTLAAAIQQQDSYDLILTGKQSVDGNSGSVFVGLARKLGYPLLVNVSKIVNVEDGNITVERLVEGGQEVVMCPLPAVVSVAKEINEPRYPSFMGIRKASKAEIPSISADGLGAESSSSVSWTNVRKPEVANTSIQMIDGGSVEEKAAALAEALLAEKVI